MAKDPYKYFRLEARELLTQFGAVALELEKGEHGDGQVQRLLRLAHTLKGAARVVKQPEIADRAHAIEEALGPFRDGAAKVPRDTIDTVMKCLDDIERRVSSLATGEESAPAGGNATASRKPTTAEESIRSVRADIEEMDALLDGVTETHTLLGNLRQAPQALERAEDLLGLLLEQLTPRGGVDGIRQTTGNRERALATAQELRKSLSGVTSHIGMTVDQIDRELNQLRDAAEQLRLVGAGSLFVSLERTVRDAARELNKSANFEGAGGEIRLDAHVLATVQGALVQIIRNAVAHGIEPEKDRLVAGKPAAGRISVDVARRGRKIVFVCRDDGRGLDLDAVRRVAAQRGLLSGGTKASSAEDLIQLLMRGGISTSDTVTEVAGRGIGLDVVRESIGQLGGEVTVRTEARLGTTFELVVPLSVASIEALAVEAAGSVVTIPADAIQTAVRVAGTEISWAANGASILHDGKSIPFISLPQALFGTRPLATRTWPTVIITSGGDPAAVGVDRLLGTMRVVVRPLSELVPVNAAVAGASLDAEGNPQLVLDPDGLMALARGGITADLIPAPAGLPILVVDDSLTTRMLEQSILESAGYEVDLAASGEEGLESVRRKPYSLILCDVEMPGMDGFTFVETLRSDPALHDIPAILVTSRAMPEDIERGRAVRAQGYVIKSEFDQAKLLTLIRSLTS